MNLLAVFTTVGEDSLRSNLDEMKRNRPSNKTFLFVASGCEEMGFVLGAVNSFLDTKDRSFLGFAKRGDNITSSLQEIL